jgi:hypothetical protein
MLGLLDDHRVKPPLEDVSLPLPPPVEGLRVRAVQAPHATGEIRPRRLEHEVVVVVHEAESMEEPREAADDAGEQPQEEAPFGVVEEDSAACVPPARHMVEGSWELEAKRTRHPSERMVRPASSARRRRFRDTVVGTSLRSPASSDPGSIASSDPWGG